MDEPGQTEGWRPAPLAPKEGERAVDLLAVGLLSLVVGAGTGVISAAFRFVLTNADRLRDVFVHWARGEATVGFFSTVLACVAATNSRRMVGSAIFALCFRQRHSSC